MIPNLRPLGSALNSAQQPYFLATILWPISCKINAGPTANNITGIANNRVTSQVFIPSVEIPDKPLTAMNPSAKVNAAVAKPRCCFSISLNSQIFLLPVGWGVACLPENIFCKSSIVNIELPDDDSEE